MHRLSAIVSAFLCYSVYGQTEGESNDNDWDVYTAIIVVVIIAGLCLMICADNSHKQFLIQNQELLQAVFGDSQVANNKRSSKGSFAKKATKTEAKKEEQKGDSEPAKAKEAKVDIIEEEEEQKASTKDVKVATDAPALNTEASDKKIPTPHKTAMDEAWNEMEDFADMIDNDGSSEEADQMGNLVDVKIEIDKRGTNSIKPDNSQNTPQSTAL